MRMRTAVYLRRSPGRGACQPKKNTPKNMTPQSSFYWEDLLRTTGQRTASPPALRNCSKDVEEVSMHATVVKG